MVSILVYFGCVSQDGEVRDQLKNYPVPWPENLIQPSDPPSVGRDTSRKPTGAAGGYSDLFPERAIREVVSLLRNSLWWKLTADAAWLRDDADGLTILCYCSWWVQIFITLTPVRGR